MDSGEHQESLEEDIKANMHAQSHGNKIVREIIVINPGWTRRTHMSLTGKGWEGHV